MEVSWSTSRPRRFTRREKPRYPLDGELGGLQTRYVRFGQYSTLLAPASNRTPSRPAGDLATTVDRDFLTVIV